MRSLLLFFLIYLLPLILSIVSSFFIVFKIGLVFMVLLLTGFHLILPHVLRQSPSKISLHLSQIFLVVYLKVLRPWPTSFHSLYNPLGSVISKNLTKYHLYADDTQLYISFTPSNSISSLEILSNTFSDILSWMSSNKLLLNPSKTEFLLVGTKQRLKFSQLTTLSVVNDIVPVSSSSFARNLGFIFDSDMSFTDQINSLSKSRLSFSYQRHPSYSSFPSSFCSYSAC